MAPALLIWNLGKVKVAPLPLNPIIRMFLVIIFPDWLENDRIVGITAAMPSGTGLDQFKEKIPDRFFDVGIAEEHAVVFARD